MTLADIDGVSSMIETEIFDMNDEKSTILDHQNIINDLNNKEKP